MIKNPNMLVYCSGPLFSPEEIGGMTAVAEVIEAAGCRTFLPHRDGLERYVMSQINNPVSRVSFLPIRRWMDRAIFCLDIYQIVERCDALVFNMNGRVPDEGGVVETAIAFATGKPLVIYKNDCRAPFGGGDNSMLAGLCHPCVPINSIDEIPAALRKEVSANPGKGAVSLSPALRKSVDTGRRIWEMMSPLQNRLGAEKKSELILRIADVCKKLDINEQD